MSFDACKLAKQQCQANPDSSADIACTLPAPSGGRRVLGSERRGVELVVSRDQCAVARSELSVLRSRSAFWTLHLV